MNWGRAVSPITTLALTHTELFDLLICMRHVVETWNVDLQSKNRERVILDNLEAAFKDSAERLK